MLPGYYGLTAASFADKIRVRRSSTSHLLIGHNGSSLDFVMKVVHTFPEVNLYWLLNGQGSFPEVPDERSALPDSNKQVRSGKGEPAKRMASKSIDRIIILYSDGSFDSYNPQ